MRDLRALLPLAALALAPAVSGCQANRTFALLSFLPGAATPRIVAEIDLTATLGGLSGSAVYKNNGQPIALPGTATLELGSGAGLLVITAVAKDASGKTVDTGSGQGTIVAGQTTPITIQFGTAPPGDGGVDLAMNDLASSDLATSDLATPRDLATADLLQPPPDLSTPNVNVVLTFSGGGGGTVTIQPPNTVCSTACSATVAQGTSVAVTAKPQVGSVFTGWTGACASFGTNRFCTLTVSADVTANARFEVLPANLVFVTSTMFPGNLGSAQAYQDRCNSLATTAGINNAAGDAYVAFMASSSYNPVALLGVSRGWVRADLLPWVDQMSTALSKGIIYYPAAYDENGARVFDFTWSGMLGDGTLFQGQNCNNWLDPAQNTSTGHTHASGKNWPANNSGISSCGGNRRVLCLMKGANVALAPAAVAGKKIYLTVRPWNPGGGVASADARCLADAPTGVVAAKAILISAGRTFADSLAAATNYVRPDGVLVGDGTTVIAGITNTFAPANIEGGIIQDGIGNYIAGNAPTIQLVWTGLQSAGTADKDTCRDWTSAAAADTGTAGSDTGWVVAGRDANFACNNTTNTFLRCAEQ